MHNKQNIIYKFFIENIVQKEGVQKEVIRLKEIDYLPNKNYSNIEEEIERADTNSNDIIHDNGTIELIPSGKSK